MTLVSIVIPCLNEERFIEKCVASVLAFDLPTGVTSEILVLDGGSTDQTKSIVREKFGALAQVQLLDNPGRIQSTAMNIGVQHARGEWIMRLDAHSLYPSEYLKLCLDTAVRTKADNVGGLFITLPGDETFEASLVQALTTHKFGVGDAGFRLGAAEGVVDTVPYGFYPRDAFEKFGKLDERLVRAQDYEFNRRIVKRGGVVWLNPAIRVYYHNQRTLARFYRKQIALDAPYNAYLWYLAPYAFAPRHAVTGVFSAGVVAGALLAPWWKTIASIYIAVVALYGVLALLMAVQQATRYRRPLFIVTLPLCVFGYHFLHGLGVLWGLGRLATHTAPVQQALNRSSVA